MRLNIRTFITALFIGMLLSVSVAYGEEDSPDLLVPGAEVQHLDWEGGLAILTVGGGHLPPGESFGIVGPDQTKTGLIEVYVLEGEEFKVMSILFRAASVEHERAEHLLQKSQEMFTYLMALTQAAGTEDMNAILEHLENNPVPSDD